MCMQVRPPEESTMGVQHINTSLCLFGMPARLWRCIKCIVLICLQSLVFLDRAFSYVLKFIFMITMTAGEINQPRQTKHL
jgi:hypothetical protein